jgi:hypothetical protein
LTMETDGTITPDDALAYAAVRRVGLSPGEA